VGQKRQLGSYRRRRSGCRTGGIHVPHLLAKPQLAVLDPRGQLVCLTIYCLTVYKRGAVEVVRRLAA
jgi:hypothetical protein